MNTGWVFDRLSLRVPLHLPVRFSANGKFSQEKALNVSRGGMFVRTEDYVKPGTEVRVEFDLTGSTPFMVKAMVVWATEGVQGNECSYAKGLGLRFTELPIQAITQLHTLCNQYRHLP